MSLFAFLASCMPCHADWLNDLSSTPPTSSTMQALNFSPPPPLPLALFSSLGFSPQPASRSAEAPARAANFVRWRKTPLLREKSASARREPWDTLVPARGPEEPREQRAANCYQSVTRPLGGPLGG